MQDSSLILVPVVLQLLQALWYIAYIAGQARHPWL